MWLDSCAGHSQTGRMPVTGFRSVSVQGQSAAFPKRGTRHTDPYEAGKRRCKAPGHERTDALQGRGFETGDLVKQAMVEICANLLERRTKDGEILNPFLVRIKRTRDRGFQPEGMSVQATSRIICAAAHEIMCGLEMDGFGDFTLPDHQEIPVDSEGLLPSKRGRGGA